MNYIDYQYYYVTFGGTLIPQEDFNKIATEASNKVRNAIMNKDITGFETEVKTATCLVAECLYNQTLKKNKINNVISGTDSIVTSEKVGDYSRTLSNVSASELETLIKDTSKEIDGILKDYLLMTGLLYNGVVNVR